MRTQKTLSKSNREQLFFFDGDIGLCQRFINNLLGEVTKSMAVQVTLSDKNPKSKGFKKIRRTQRNEVSTNGLDFIVCRTECYILDSFNIKIGDSFWMKAKILD